MPYGPCRPASVRAWGLTIRSYIFLPKSSNWSRFTSGRRARDFGSMSLGNAGSTGDADWDEFCCGGAAEPRTTIAKDAATSTASEYQSFIAPLKFRDLWSEYKPYKECREELSGGQRHGFRIATPVCCVVLKSHAFRLR